MNHNDFNDVITRQMTRCLGVLVRKGDEYATDEDRLANFRTAAALQGCSMERALAGMMAKHTVSVYEMLNNPLGVELEQWDEKITDHINYLLLLRAVIEQTPTQTRLPL